jgi:AcrR family transcriptional regulator
MNNPEPNIRKTILATAKCLFIEYGYHGLAMRQISDALHVSKAALYYHFKDKEELFIAILKLNLNEIEKAIDLIQARQVSYQDQIILFVEYVLNQPAEERAIIRLGSQEMGQLSETARTEFDRTYHEKFIGKLQSIFRKGVENKEFRPIDPAIATWALLGMMYPYFYPSQGKTKPLPPATIQQIIHIYLEGVSLPG